jgi:trehalose 6-phosphate phosphatase
MTMTTLPPFERVALLLDLDGTLLDIAPTPDAVVVAPELPDTLRGLRTHLGDALAIVTGRPLETVDALLGDAPYAVAGEHGGVIRYAPGDAPERPHLPSVPPEWLNAAALLVAGHPGTLLEKKTRGFALHFRGAPEAGPGFREALIRLLAGDDKFDLLSAHMAWEVRPRGADKARAVAALMARAPFTGRWPLFIGDDVTDEQGMQVARTLGGKGLMVDAAFGDPTGVRGWLAGAARLADWPPLPGPKPCD